MQLVHEHCCRWWNTWDRKASLREWQISQIFNSSVTIHASFYRLRVIPFWIKSYFILLEIKILLLFEESASKPADNASGVSGSSENRLHNVVVQCQCCVRVSVDTEKAAAGGGHRGFPPPPPPQAVSRHQLLRWYDSQQPLQGPRTQWSPEPVITIGTRAYQQGDLTLRWVAANITQVSWVDGGRVKLCVGCGKKNV